jgi:hypothetical protein
VTLFYPDVSNLQWGGPNYNGAAALTAFLERLKPEFAGVVGKVSQGSGFADPDWQTLRSWCEGNDLSWLGYHYVDTSDADAQARCFVNNNGGPFAMLDVEDGSGDIDQFWAVVNAFNNAGVSITLAYLPAWYWEDIGEPDLSPLAQNQIALVSSNYAGGPAPASVIYADSGGDSGPGWNPYGDAFPTCWQFSDMAEVAGITVDCNAYRGAGPNLDALFTGAIFN